MTGNNAAVARRPRGLLQAFTENVGPALVAVGGSTAMTAITVLAEPESSLLPVSSRRRALCASMVSGVAAVWAGIWVAAGGPRRHRIGLVILGAAFVPFIYSVNAGDFDPELHAAIFDALA